MTPYKYVAMDEFGFKQLYNELEQAEEYARKMSIEYARSDICVFVMHIPPYAQPSIMTANDVNQFVGESWQVAKSYYHGQADADGRFKTYHILNRDQ